jgi:hypothetical protein
LKDFAYESIFRKSGDEYLNPVFLASCWKQHQRGQRDWSALLWCVLMFKTWETSAR